MSNLGLYQFVTTVSKKVGGPHKFIGIVAICGYVVGRTVEGGIKAFIAPKSPSKFKSMTFVITSPGTDEQGLSFTGGEQYRVINSDGDAIQIEKIGDANNPYFVSSEFLHSISDFPGK